MHERSHAQAQTAEATTIEKVEVTGSAIRRTDTETPSPIQVISSEDLKRTGQTSVSEVLRNLAANGSGSLSQSFNFAFAIAGVVNIILKKTFNGLHVSGEIGEAQRGDGQTTHLSTIFGLGDLGADGRNGYVALEYRHQEPILSSNDRLLVVDARLESLLQRIGSLRFEPVTHAGFYVEVHRLLRNPELRTRPSWGR
jgi:outer membrane receptor protein involved in Fe transport